MKQLKNWFCTAWLLKLRQMYGNRLHVINKFYELFPLGFIEYVYFMPKECR